MPKTDLVRRIDQRSLIDGAGFGAARAYLSGAIEQPSGSLAGWTIELGHLYSGTGPTRTGLMPGSWPFYAGADMPNDAPFRVSVTGALFASNATIAGEITALSGIIGGWTIATDRLYAGLGSNRVGLAPGSFPFYAGAEDPAIAPFRVDTLGKLTAADATITGTVLAAGGTIILGDNGFWLGDPDYGTGLTLNEVKDVYGVGTGDFGLRIYDSVGVPHISLISREGNVPYFRLGTQNAETWLQWDENGLELKGTITATDGQITGALYVGAAAPRILIDGTNKLI